MNIFIQNLSMINLCTNIIIALLAGFAVISPRVRSTSIEIFAYAVVFMGAIVSIEQAYSPTPSQTVMNIGAAIIGAYWLCRFHFRRKHHGNYRKQDDIHSQFHNRRSAD